MKPFQALKALKSYLIALFLLFTFYPCISFSKTYSLNECLLMALRKNGDILQAKKSAEEAALRSSQIKALLYPSLKINASCGYISELNSIELKGFGNKMYIGEHEKTDASINLTQLLYSGKSVENNIKAYESLSASALLESKIAETEIRFDVIKFFYNLYKTMELKKVAFASREQIELHYRDAKNLLDQGMLLKNELLTIDMRRLEADLIILQTKNSLLKAKAMLSEKIGHDPEEPLDISAGFINIKSMPDPQKLLKESCLTQEQKMLRENEKAADSAALASKGALMPQVGLDVSCHYSWPGFSSGNPLWSPWWQAGINVSWNIFDMDRLKLARNEALTKKERLKEAVTTLDRKILLQRINAKLNYEENLKKERIYLKKLATANDNLRITRNNFKNGMSKSGDCLDALTEVTSAQTDLAVIRADLMISLADYLMSLGRIEIFEEIPGFTPINGEYKND